MSDHDEALAKLVSVIGRVKEEHKKVYGDEAHMSRSYVLLMLAPMLRKSFGEDFMSDDFINKLVDKCAKEQV